MKTRNLLVTLLACLVALSPVSPLLVSQSHADEIGDLAKLANSKHAAALHVATGVGPHSFGVFISPDGLALVDIRALVNKVIPKCRTVTGEELPFGRVLGVIPHCELAVMKFSYKPKVWLEIPDTEPAVGDNLAIVPLLDNADWGESIPPIVGPLLCKVSAMTPRSRVPSFIKVFSIGSGRTPKQQLGLGPGRFVVDKEGRLVGFVGSRVPAGAQTFIYVVPVCGMMPEFNRRLSAGVKVEFPIPAAANPIDATALVPGFDEMDLALVQKDMVNFRSRLDALRSEYPDSFILKIRSKYLYHPSYTGNFNIDPAVLKEFPEPAADQPAAVRTMMWSMRADVLTYMMKIDEAVEAKRAAVAASPANYPDEKIGLARLIKHMGGEAKSEGDKELAKKKFTEALELCREIYRFSPDSIYVMQMYEELLTELDMVLTEEAEMVRKRRTDLTLLYNRFNFKK